MFRVSSRRLPRARFFYSGFFLGEFEANFSVLEFEVRGKWAAFFRDEPREKIGLAGRDQFLQLLFGDLALQNHFAHAEVARLWRRDCIFARVRFFQNINLPFLANGT